MAASDKDLVQKNKSIKYCLVNNYIPFLEVRIGNRAELTDAVTYLTDLDVAGVGLSPWGGLNKVLFDCKTIGKTSPINRAFWASGVVNYTGFTEAFVILRRDASESHRLSAKSVSVHLFSERIFDKYAEASNIEYLSVQSYLADIERWGRYRTQFKAKLSELDEFVNEQIVIEQNPQRALRRLIAKGRSCRGELDPGKPFDQTIFLQVIASAVYLLSLMVHDFKNLFAPDYEKEEFSQLLRYYVWGGRESYSLGQRLKSALAQKNGDDGGVFELPEWESFLELIRTLLESPSLLIGTCIPVKELSFRSLGSVSIESDDRIITALSQNKRARQFLFRIAAYLVKALGVPEEFKTNFELQLNSILVRQKGTDQFAGSADCRKVADK